MKRAMASVQEVVELRPIVGADAIELARIKGWQCVVKKGDFAVGDRGVYFEIDAVPPDAEAFRFLWTPKGAASAARPASYRIRTMTLRRCLSQGLLLTLDEAGVDGSLGVGTDVSDVLGVGKYEPPLPHGGGDAAGAFPGIVPKTDETRVQSAPGVLDELRGLPWVATQKCDGTSSTFLVDPSDETFHVCGRNWSLRRGANAYWGIAERLDLESKLRATGNRWAVQGEICGPGIQKNPMGLPGTRLFVFSIYDLREARFVGDAELRAITSELDLDPVPVVEQGDAFDLDQDALLRLAEGLYPGTKNQREGIVIRPAVERFSETLAGRLSFKAISNRYPLGERD